MNTLSFFTVVPPLQLPLLTAGLLPLDPLTHLLDSQLVAEQAGDDRARQISYAPAARDPCSASQFSINPYLMMGRDLQFRLNRVHADPARSLIS
jgi:hypothetical protein